MVYSLSPFGKPSGLVGVPILPVLTPLMALPAVFPFFFLLAAGEEVGWMGIIRAKLTTGARRAPPADRTVGMRPHFLVDLQEEKSGFTSR
jgi:hypothetical protein